MTKTIVIVCICLLAASAAGAKDAPEFRRLTVEEIAAVDVGSRQDCTVGNLEPIYYSVSGWMTGFEGYKFLFDPNPQCACPLGFLVESVHMVLSFPDDGSIKYPYSFTASVGLGEGSWDPAAGCWVPGEDDCGSGQFLVSIPAAGLYDVSLPLPCECAYFRDPTGQAYVYAVSFYFHDEILAHLVTDDAPTACTSYNDWGGGWADLVGGYGFPGNLAMWAEAACCDQPVGQEMKSFGQVKSLYR